jgi:thioredoxin reductase
VIGKRLLVIGAGPIGIAAALGGARLGWDVTVLEQNTIGGSMLRWGPTRFFSPLAMNLPPGIPVASPDAILTGPEFVENVLAPLAQTSLDGRVKCGHRVVAVGRSRLNKGDFFKHPIRAERPFHVLTETPHGERIFEAEAVIDASGNYGQPVSLGAGGIPALGERALGHRLIRDLGTLDQRLPSLAGKAILLAGHGHSAANAIVRLSNLATRVVWATRSLNRRPCTEVASDPLPERQRIVNEANQLAAQPPAWLRVERQATVEAIGLRDADQFEIKLSGARTVFVDEVIGLTGYRPDLSILSELTIRIDPATEGSAGLARALSNVTDCLSVPAVAPEDLDSGEPGFYLAGAKSYGRSRTFLLQSGYQQLDTILKRLDRAAS